MKRRFVGIMMGVACAASPALAEEQLWLADFTFKRVTVPVAGATNRINIQIAPGEPYAPTGPAEAGTTSGGVRRGTDGVAGATPRATELDWFWEAVPPSLDASIPGRLILAMDAMSKAPEGKGVTEPRLSALHKIAEDHGRDILINTIGTTVSPALVLAVIAVESAGDSDATSRVGAQGLMQLMPATAERFGVKDSLDPSQNIKGGVAYLNWLMDEFNDDPVLFLAAYNAGEGAIWDNGGVPDYAETRAYVPKVLAAWSVARALCVTPPELMSDGCVFNLNGE